MNLQQGNEDKITNDSSAPGVPNPPTGGIQVVVSIPERVTIKMVDASALGDYEYHGAVTAALFGVTVGFTVPAIQELGNGTPLGTTFLVVAAVFGCLTVCSGIMAARKRAALTKAGREIELQTASAKLV